MVDAWLKWQSGCEGRKEGGKGASRRGRLRKGGESWWGKTSGFGLGGCLFWVGELCQVRNGLTPCHHGISPLHSPLVLLCFFHLYFFYLFFFLSSSSSSTPALLWKFWTDLKIDNSRTEASQSRDQTTTVHKEKVQVGLVRSLTVTAKPGKTFCLAWTRSFFPLSHPTFRISRENFYFPIFL